MTSKASFARHEFAFAMLTASVVCVSMIAASKPSLAQDAATEGARSEGTRVIERGSDAHKALNMAEPYQTKEERLRAKPLDWNSTIGTPQPRALSPAEQETLRAAQPEASSSGEPNSAAQEEARKLHPEDWK